MSLIRAMIKTRRGNGYSRNKLAKVQNDRLNELVRFAKENSPFYENLYKTIGKRFCLEDLPPVSKPELMATLTM